MSLAFMGSDADALTDSWVHSYNDLHRPVASSRNPHKNYPSGTLTKIQGQAEVEAEAEAEAEAGVEAAAEAKVIGS